MQLSRGKELCEKIIGGLSIGHPDLIIVSGLAYGIDIACHKAALSHNLLTVGVSGTWDSRQSIHPFMTP